MSNNASPLKQVMKSERRYKECLTTEENEDDTMLGEGDAELELY